MSCYITYQTIDGQQVAVRNYIGNVDVQMTSANNGGAGFAPPACSAGSSSHAAAPAAAAQSVPEPSTVALFAVALAVGVVVHAHQGARRLSRIPPPQPHPSLPA